MVVTEDIQTFGKGFSIFCVKDLWYLTVGVPASPIHVSHAPSGEELQMSSPRRDPRRRYKQALVLQRNRYFKRLVSVPRDFSLAWSQNADEVNGGIESAP